MDITNPPLTTETRHRGWYNDQVLPMAKESVIAIVLGLVLGIIVALAAVVYTVNVQKNQNTKIQKKTSESTSSSTLISVTIPPTVTVLRSLEIASPQSGSTTVEKTTTIKGNAGAKTLLIVQSPIKTLATTSEKDSYSIEFPLALGENVITVSAYHDGAVLPVQKKLYIYRLNP